MRRESVRLELIDAGFSTGMAKDAAATALLKRELNSLSGTSVRTSRDQDAVAKSIDKTSTAARNGGKDIDKFSGRLRLLTDAAFTLGPALIPIGAVAIPALIGMAAQLGTVAGAAGVAILAFNGVGDSLKALDAYQLEPTQKNLEKMREEFDKIGPAGEHFVRFLDGLEPQLHSLQDAARQGLFPGVEEGLTHLLDLLPQARQIVFNLADALGQLASDAGAGLSGEGFSDFFNYLETDAGPMLVQFGHTIGNVAEGIGHLFVGFAPLTRDFSSGMERMSQSFADWAAGLSQTDGFRDFVAYVRESAPQVLHLLGAMGEAFVGILKAAAPVGNVVVPALTALAKALGAIADSPVGGPLFATAAALVAVNRAISVGESVFNKYAGGLDATTGGLTRLQKAAATAGFALAGLTIVDKLQNGADKAAPSINALTNSLNDLGSAGTGKLPDDLDDLAAGIDRLADPNKAQALQDTLSSALGGIGNDSLHDNAVKQIEALDQALTGIVNNQGPEAAKRALDGLRRSAGLSASQFDDLIGLMPQYKDALAGADSAAAAAANSTRRLGRSAGLTRSEIRGLVSAMEEQRTAALGAFDAVTRYNEALANARKRAKQTEAGIDATTQAGRKNRDALSQLAGAWNNQSDAVRNNTAKFREARGAFIQTATAMGVPKKAAAELANKLLEIPKQRVVQIEMQGTDRSLYQIGAVRNAIDALHDKTVNINTISTQTRIIKQIDIMEHHADGGTVRGPRYPYGDKVHVMLAPGEEVITNRNGEADRFRADRAAGRIPGYADGGTVLGYADGGRVRGRGRDDDRGVGGALHRLKERLDDARKALEKETDQRKKLIDRRNELRSGITSGLRSDIFGESGAFGAASSPIGALRADIAKGRRFADLVNQLKRKGVNGAALQEIIASGDIDRAEMMESMTRSSLGTYERLYNQRNRVLVAAGNAGGTAVYGRQVAAQTRELEHIRAEVRHLTAAVKHADKHNQHGHKENARDVTKGVNGAGSRGKRNQRRGGAYRAD